MGVDGAMRYARTIAYSSEQVLKFTYDQAVKYRDSPGVYVECGVAAGAQIIAMAAGAPNKTIYAFDSFEGIPFPSNRDNQMPGIRMLEPWEQKVLPEPGKALLETTGATSVSIIDFWAHIKASGVNKQHIFDVKGWFEESVQHFQEEIAILRLDADLYNSTYVCLKHLYPKVIEGGIVIVDDWALPGCKSAVCDYFSNDLDFYRWRMSVQFIEGKDSTVAHWTK